MRAITKFGGILVVCIWAATCAVCAAEFSARVVPTSATQDALILKPKWPNLLPVPRVDQRRVAQSHQSLLLDCSKIGRAQRGLRDALRNGGHLSPLASRSDGFPAPGAELSVDAKYHIRRNQDRFGELAQRFGCRGR